MPKHLLIVIALVLLSSNYSAQTDFNNYITLRSSGDIPEDFTKQTYDKIKEGMQSDRTELKGSQQKIFLEGTNYAIDEILHSGLVIYGDPITKYIERVADKLLRKNGDLKSNLRIYTIKSNAANAFSTDQGIVFVTTGLIAQLTSEAQLAYILAHEISHFTEKHVLETFDLSVGNELRNYDRINKLSQHSKENEFEADKLGIALYHAAGYAQSEILSTFDVLMYSYLPFDELAFPKTYFNSAQIFVPESLFPTKIYEIKAIEDYNDENSSHPNIKKRKEAAESEIGALNNWGDALQFQSEDLFLEVRNLARFESVRSDILDAKYGDAMYSIFLLEKEFPNSIYLKRMKSQVWLNLMLYKAENLSAKALDKTSELEGESATLHYLLKKLNRDGMITLALRQVYDLHKAYPDDQEITAIYQHLIRDLAANDKFKIENYSKKTFFEAAKDYENSKKDTLKSTSTETPSGSKYDRIKNKKNADNPQNFDSTKFYLYGLVDILGESEFLELYNNQKAKEQQKLKDEELYNSLSKREKNKIDRKKESEQYSIGLKEIIVVEPMVISYRRGQIDNIKSEKLETNFSLAIEDAAKSIGVTTHNIDSRTLQTRGTQGYNERSTLISLLDQLAQEDEIDIFPVDFQLLKGIQNDFGTKKVMFSLVEHAYYPNISFSGVFSSILFYPALLVYIPVGVLTGSNTELNVLILDLEKGTIDNGINYYFKDAPKKMQLGAHMYDIFKKFSSTANN